MSAITGSPQERREYLKQEAADMRRKAMEYRNSGDQVEAKRLEDLAEEADQSAAGIDNELAEISQRR
jgi:recombinational DNA repair ATPase RecF